VVIPVGQKLLRGVLKIIAAVDAREYGVAHRDHLGELDSTGIRQIRRNGELFNREGWRGGWRGGWREGWREDWPEVRP